MIIKAQVEAAGLEVVGTEYADMDQTDFSAIISKIELKTKIENAIFRP